MPPTPPELEPDGCGPRARSPTRPMKSSSAPWMSSSLACAAALASPPARNRSEPARKLRPATTA